MLNSAPSSNCQTGSRRALLIAVFSALLTFGSAPLGHGQTPALPPIVIKKVDGTLGAAATQMLGRHLQQSATLQLVTSPNGAFIAEIRLELGNKLSGKLVSAEGKTLFERKYDRSDMDHDLRQFCDDIVLAITKRPGIATSQIAFVSNKSGSNEIFVCNYEGKNVRQITRDSRNNLSPAFCPRGLRLIHTTHAPGFADLIRIDLTRAQPAPLVKQQGAKSEAAFSTDGKRAAYALTVNGNADLYTVKADGGKPKLLIASPAHEATPSWSPNGKQIVYSSNGGGTPQLYLIDSKGGKPQLLPTGQPDCRKPCWSPDGRSIAYVSGGTHPAVTIYDLPSRKSRVLSAGDSPSWGANSRHLVFAYQGNIYRADTATGTSVPIISGAGAASDPSWTR